MTLAQMFPYVLVMAVVTYLIRMLPLAVFRKKITNRFVLSFLHYVPYAVLAAMTFPAIFTATGDIWSSLAGVIVSVVLAYLEKSLLTVALASCGAAFAVELILRYLL